MRLKYGLIWKRGVNYMWRKAANAGGLTPLLDENGNVVVTKGGDGRQ